jgi:hypothetical protein
MAITIRQVSSLPNFISEILRIRDLWEREDAEEAERRGDDLDPLQTWFRDHANARWRLIPQLYRLEHANENEIRSEFKLRAFQLMTEPHVPGNDREWYFLMQHYGAPTRLLDWTDSALIALYFAVKTQRRYAESAVWMLDPEWLNATVLNKVDESNYVSGVLLPDWAEAEPWFPDPFEQALHVTLPIAIDPPHISRRVSVQRSRFTIHGKSNRGLDSLLGSESKPRLVKLTIARNVGREILRDLATSGIVETSVFPDLEGLSRELETKWGQMAPNRPTKQEIASKAAAKSRTRGAKERKASQSKKLGA